ncbi:helix-turn-helix transcriptional regulator [Azospirillum soli]|uniref:helix-turn-helix transcriptional regulator n=1 Tax=Azospirillum soli TaxID=1304799 RepID=UPI001AE9E90E|nr:putative DNA-binding transcriptional regulator YafY [Azospirillum soli]
MVAVEEQDAPATRRVAGDVQAVAPDIVSALRTVTIACRRVRLRDRSHTGEAWHRVCPYGFLYGRRPYLTFSLNPGVFAYRSFRLANILEVEDTGQPFRRDDFAHNDWAARSCGVFQEEPFDVDWRFAPAVAAEARQFLFPPSQRLDDEPDGGVTVRFRAGGALEMAWHLYTWGRSVTVVKPSDFWDRVERAGSLRLDARTG